MVCGLRFDCPGFSGLARSTIYHGLSDIRHNVSAAAERTRKKGGGRKKKAVRTPPLWSILRA
jgi:hypothetical protein